MLDSVLGLKTDTSVFVLLSHSTLMATRYNMVKTEKEYNPALFSRLIIYHI